MKAIDLNEAFSRITTYWDPHIAGELNGQQVKCTKLKGEFIWHKHEAEDELFLVHRGILHMRLRTGLVVISSERSSSSPAVPSTSPMQPKKSKWSSLSRPAP